MRIVRQYDINNDRFPCRLDVLYGYKTIRQQLACRISANSTVWTARPVAPRAA